MPIDASIGSSQTSVTTTHRDFRAGGVQYLPQRIVILAQGATGMVYSTEKWQATGAEAGGSKYGWGCPIHSTLLELMPTDGREGVGGIPVTVLPLVDDGSGVAANGQIVPSGTATVQSSYRARIGGVLSRAFVIGTAALVTAELTKACRAIHDAIDAVLEMPVEVTYDYGTVTAAALNGTGNGTVGTFTTTGNPMPGVWRLQVVTAVTNGGVWSLTNPDGVVVANNLTQTVGAGTATALAAGGLGFTITDGSTDFGLGAYFDITVPATGVNQIAKWKGDTGNKIKIEILGESVGLTFAITSMTGGLVNPSITAALAQIGNVNETLILNQFGNEDTVILDALKNFGEGRWAPEVHKPLMAFCGNTDVDVTTAKAVFSARQLDRVNVQLNAPGSPNMPFVVAARELALIASVANGNPPTGYNAEVADGITPGTDGQQWDATAKEIAFDNGISTVDVVDGVVQLADIITPWRPDGQNPPAYRWVQDIVKLQNVLYNIDRIFKRKDWAAAPLVPDEQPVANPNIRQPKAAKAEVKVMIDDLAAEGIVSDPEFSKANVTANIDTQNPKKLNVKIPIKLSGNTQQKAIDLEFGFFFGAAQAA